VDQSPIDKAELVNAVIEALKASPKNNSQLAREAGCSDEYISMLRKGKRSKIEGFLFPLCNALGIDPVTRLPFSETKSDDSANQSGHPRRYRVRVVKSTTESTTRGMVFMERPAFPSEFEVSEEEAGLIYSRRAVASDPFACFTIALEELRLGKSQMPDLAVREQIEADNAIDCINGILRRQAERRAKTKEG
jgi:transcriptional regulator with XRE-family HTH domain